MNIDWEATRGLIALYWKVIKVVLVIAVGYWVAEAFRMDRAWTYFLGVVISLFIS